MRIARRTLESLFDWFLHRQERYVRRCEARYDDAATRLERAKRLRLAERALDREREVEAAAVRLTKARADLDTLYRRQRVMKGAGS